MSSQLAASLSSLSEHVRVRSQPLPELHSPDEFAAAFDVFADAKLVLLGEATHGTAEFYKARAAITRRLAERHGFRILALEADWPDAAELAASSGSTEYGASVAPLRDFRAGCGATWSSRIS
jgi:erythromycin esterase-like protein